MSLHIPKSHLRSYSELATHLLAHFVSRLIASLGTHLFMQLEEVEGKAQLSFIVTGAEMESEMLKPKLVTIPYIF